MIIRPVFGRGYRIPPDPYFANVVLLVHGNGTNNGTSFPDSSVSNRTPTVGGNAKTSTAQSKFNGSSMLFDGSGDYVSYPDSDDFSFGASFTIECFIRQAGAETGTGILVGKFVDSVGSREWVLTVEGNTPKFYTYDGSSLVTSLSSSSTISNGTWYHVAVSYDGTTARLYLDGTLVASHTNSLGMSNRTTAAYLGGNGTYGFNGYIAEARVTKGVARYTSAFTPPTLPHPNS